MQSVPYSRHREPPIAWRELCSSARKPGGARAVLHTNIIPHKTEMSRPYARPDYPAWFALLRRIPVPPPSAVSLQRRVNLPRYPVSRTTQIVEPLREPVTRYVWVSLKRVEGIIARTIENARTNTNDGIHRVAKTLHGEEHPANAARVALPEEVL